MLTRENVTSYVIATLPNEDLDEYDLHAISTGVVVSALAQPQWLMEIDVTAVIPDDWQGEAAE